MEIHVTQDTIGENGLLNFDTISQNRILPQVLLYNSRKQCLVYTQNGFLRLAQVPQLRILACFKSTISSSSSDLLDQFIYHFSFTRFRSEKYPNDINNLSTCGNDLGQETVLSLCLERVFMSGLSASIENFGMFQTHYFIQFE